MDLEVGEIPVWGKTLPVDSVQEIVKTDPQFVPERYIREQEERPCNDLSSLPSEIPIIDLSLLSYRSEDEFRKLDLACRDWGFFQIINHGIREELLEIMKVAAAGFFQLPLEEKIKYKMGGDFQGFGQPYIVSEHQKLDWTDVLILFMTPTKFRKSNYWPTTPPELKEAVEAYSIEVNRVAEELLAGLSLILGMDEHGLLRRHGEVMAALRINYYPICAKPDLVLGLSPHSDGGSISILFQDDDVTGLQIRHDDGWVTVKPISNALVVNIGDVLEVWSNGRYKSIEHRAVVNENKVRMSFATFICPNQDVEIEPLDHMLDGNQCPRLYKKINYGDYLKHLSERKLEGKTLFHSLKIEK